MLNINKNANETTLTIALEGRLDTTTAPELEGEMMGSLDGVEELVLDMADLEYISSAGLRVLLSAHKIMIRQGSMEIHNASDYIKEIFEVTGFSDILTVI